MPPSWSDSTRRATASPMPDPFCFVVKNGTKMRSRHSSGIGEPLSEMSITTESSLHEREQMSIFVAPASTALCRRFTSARTISVRSALTIKSFSVCIFTEAFAIDSLSRVVASDMRSAT